MTVLLNPDNKYRNALFLGDRMIINGNSGLKDIEIRYDENKRAVLYLKISEFNLYIQTEKCPEESRFGEVQKAFGDRTKMLALRPVCEMLTISPTACDGCPKTPIRSTAT